MLRKTFFAAPVVCYVLALYMIGCREEELDMRCILRILSSAGIVFAGFVLFARILYEFARLAEISGASFFIGRLALASVVFLLPTSYFGLTTLFDSYVPASLLTLGVVLLADPLMVNKSFLAKLVGASEKFWGSYPPAKVSDLRRPFFITVFYFVLLPYGLYVL